MRGRPNARARSLGPGRVASLVWRGVCLHAPALLLAALLLVMGAADTQFLCFQYGEQAVFVLMSARTRGNCPVFTSSVLVHVALVPDSPSPPPPPVSFRQEFTYSPRDNVGPYPPPRKPSEPPYGSRKLRTRHTPPPLASLAHPRRAQAEEFYMG